MKLCKCCKKKLNNKVSIFCDYKCFLKFYKKPRNVYKHKQEFGRPRLNKMTIKEMALREGISVPTFYKRIRRTQFRDSLPAWWTDKQKDEYEKIQAATECLSKEICKYQISKKSMM